MYAMIKCSDKTRPEYLHFQFKAFGCLQFIKLTPFSHGNIFFDLQLFLRLIFQGYI